MTSVFTARRGNHKRGGASFRWSFGPHSAWGSIESTTILTTHPSLPDRPLLTQYSVLFIATIRSETCKSLLPIMDYKMSYDDVDDDVINQEDWTIFVQLGIDFLSQQVNVIDSSLPQSTSLRRVSF